MAGPPERTSNLTPVSLPLAISGPGRRGLLVGVDGVAVADHLVHLRRARPPGSSRSGTRPCRGRRPSRRAAAAAAGCRRSSLPPVVAAPPAAVACRVVAADPLAPRRGAAALSAPPRHAATSSSAGDRHGEHARLFLWWCSPLWWWWVEGGAQCAAGVGVPIADAPRCPSQPKKMNTTRPSRAARMIGGDHLAPCSRWR